jgi:Ca-activated chloride channel family protein
MDAPLETIARATGGAMLRLGLASTDLGGLYRERIEPEASSRRLAQRSGEREERFGLFLLSGLAFIVAGFWPARARLSYRRAWFLLPLSAMIASAGADSDSETTTRVIEQGRVAYAANRFEEAATMFKKAVAQRPDDSIPHYNLAAAHYQLGHFDEAAQHYDDARARAKADPALRTKIDYGLGNTALSRGNFAEALRHYDDCLGSQARGPALDAVRTDAAINRAFAVEQARRTIAPPDEETDSSSKPPARSRNPSGKSGGSSSNTTTSYSGASPAQNPTAPTNPDVRGPGGAGGTGTSTVPPAESTARDQLSRAMENIREARKRRLDPSPPSRADADRKDW